jgi:uncharacterized protein (DUF934 family)
MHIIRDRRITEDQWLHAPEGACADRCGAVTVALADWRRHRAELVQRESPVGVRLCAADDLDEIAGHLDAIDLVAFEFASFTDGRAYSHARILRERYGYRGEIRARGDVSRDRLAFMERCGFNAFEVRADSNPSDALGTALETALGTALGAFGEISDVYQPAADTRPAIGSRRA